MKLSLSLHGAAVALLAFALHVLANPVPADPEPASQAQSNSWPATPGPSQQQEWPPPAVYHKRPPLYKGYPNYQKPKTKSPDPPRGSLQARSFVPGMGDRVVNGGPFNALYRFTKDIAPLHFCKGDENTAGPAVPVVGRPGANIEDCAVLADKLRHRAVYHIDFTEYPHPKHRTLVRYRGCSLGVQLHSHEDSLQVIASSYALIFMKAIVMTNQDVLDALLETLVNPTTDGRIAPKSGLMSCPDWLTVLNPKKSDHWEVVWVSVQWDVYGDQWDDTRRA